MATAGHMGEQPEFTDNERETLRAIVAHIIPADEAIGVPGADDDSIFADVARTGRRDAAALRGAITEVDALAGGRFCDLPNGEQAELLERFRAARPDLARACELVTARCYYRDRRVMRSIGMEVRPPFPLGFEVEQGDWGLLEPVQRRGKIYRNAE